MGKAIRILDLDLSSGNIGQVTPASFKSFNKLQYISSTGTQYIDTGVLVKSGLHVVLKMKFNNASTVMGGDEGFAKKSFSFIIASSDPPYLTYGNQYHQLKKGQINSGSYIFDFNDNVWVFKSFGGTTVLSYTFNEETFTGNSNIYLFGISRNGSAVTSALFNGNIYECQIYDGDILVRDYVAAERKYDLTAGLFDKVNNVFYVNKGTGAFEKGPYAE